MTTIDIAEATASLAAYARTNRRRTLVVLRRGRPIAALMPISSPADRTYPVRGRRYLRASDRRPGATGRGYTMSSQGFGESMTSSELIAGWPP